MNCGPKILLVNRLSVMGAFADETSMCAEKKKNQGILQLISWAHGLPRKPLHIREAIKNTETSWANPRVKLHYQV